MEIKDILKKELIQRIIYGLGLVLWTLILIEELIDFPHAESSLNISYLTLYLIPAIILTIQIIRNNRIFWWLIFGLFSTFILITLYLGITDWIGRSGNHVKAIDWTLHDVSLVLIFVTMGVIDWIIFKIKPKRII
jgi:hypothetical protein